MNRDAKHLNLLAVFWLVLLVGLLSAPAQTQPAPATSPQIYEVQSGDSLAKIARHYGVTVKAIMAANDLPDTKIKIGQRLAIPSVSATVIAPAAPVWTNHPPDVPPPADTPEPHVWLQSATHQVEIGVCDKYGSGDFPARFVVTGPDGAVYKAPPEVTDQKRQSGQESYAMAYVHFPSDFRARWQEGRYSWQCFVETNCVASGAFEYCCRSNACVVIIKQ